MCGVCFYSVKDLNQRYALESQIMEFGQIPKQLFTSPHPQRSPTPGASTGISSPLPVSTPPIQPQGEVISPMTCHTLDFGANSVRATVTEHEDQFLWLAVLDTVQTSGC